MVDDRTQIYGLRSNQVIFKLIMIDNGVFDIDDGYQDDKYIYEKRTENVHTCLLNAAMSSLKDSDEHTSAP